jgi:hypothetical protein
VVLLVFFLFFFSLYLLMVEDLQALIKFPVNYFCERQKKFSISSNNARNTQRILRRRDRQLSRCTNRSCDYLNLEQSILCSP